MSLKCSIFGHRFDEPAVERSRDESGSEVVITIREVQTCDRCGHQRIVSENKEVTTLEPTDAPPDKSEPIEESPPAGNADGPQATQFAGEGGIMADEEPVVPEAEPDAGEATEEASAESGPDDGIILEEEGTESTAVDRDPGAWPEEPADSEPEWEPPTDPVPEDAVEPDPSPTIEPTGEAVTVPEGIYRCQSCGFTTPVASSSLREGDFCPECHTGALVLETGTE
jgi:DNA-directed RNA polymerase subunit RPC12/RpoP